MKNTLVMLLIVYSTGCATMDMDGLKGWWNATDHWKNDLTDAQRTSYNNDTWNTWNKQFGIPSSFGREYIIVGGKAYPKYPDDAWWARHQKLKIIVKESGQTIVTHPNKIKPAWATHWFMDIKK